MFNEFWQFYSPSMEIILLASLELLIQCITGYIIEPILHVWNKSHMAMVLFLYYDIGFYLLIFYLVFLH